jgi:hypothetical protein
VNTHKVLEISVLLSIKKICTLVWGIKYLSPPSNHLGPTKGQEKL